MSENVISHLQPDIDSTYPQTDVTGIHSNADISGSHSHPVNTVFVSSDLHTGM